MDEKFIFSAQNPLIKRLLSLQQKSSARRQHKLFVVEGVREVTHCLEGGFCMDTLFVCDALLPPSATPLFLQAREVIKVSQPLYEKIAYRGTTEGIVATVCMCQKSLADLHLTESPFVVVLEGVEKPGNLGAVLRSADAAKVDAVIVCDPLTDLYNPNLIRSSLGAVFTVPVVACTSQECLDFLQVRHINILTAQLQDSKFYYDTDMTQPTAIVMGTESTGLTQSWRDAATAHIKIPMLGWLDSLNVSVSAAILMFEGVRQRQGK